MIIEMLLGVIFNFFDFLLVFQIPSLPEDVNEYITAFFNYLEAGASLLAAYTPLRYLLVLFALILAVDAAILIYHFVMWVIKKIPFLGMS